MLNVYLRSGNKKTNTFVIIGNEHKNWRDVSDFLLGFVSFLLKSYFSKLKLKIKSFKEKSIFIK